MLRLFGVAHLVIPDPGVTLFGIRNPDDVRGILRTGGQLEAQRIDKIRFR